MNVSIKDTNVIILFGDGAVKMFISLVERWGQILLPGQWKGFQFFLVASEPPEQDSFVHLDARLVNNKNTVFYAFGDPVPTGEDFYALIGDKIDSGYVHVHVVCDSEGKEAPYEWMMQSFKSLSGVGILNIDYTYYLIVGRNHTPSEREAMMALISDQPGSTVFIGEENEHGGRVSVENRYSATILTILLNAARELILKRELAYSIGYSALNANGSELRRMRESTVCRALIALLGKPVTSVTEASECVDIWPEGVTSFQNARTWLESYTRDHFQKPTAVMIKNAWITVRMNPDLPESEALRRMKRFADLNYTGENNVGSKAKELAWSVESAIRDCLCGNIMTACISESVFNEIADMFRRIASQEVVPHGCTYPKKTLKQRFGAGAEEYLRECKRVVYRSIENYMIEKNLSVYAAEMEGCYRRLADWLKKIQIDDTTDYHAITAQTVLQELLSELESDDAGDMLRLGTKYKDYLEALNRLNLTLTDLTGDINRQFYQKDGTLVEKEWLNYVREAGNKAEAKLPAEYKGGFFRVLNTEFSTPEAREKFFDEYLCMGTRMYYNLKSQLSPGVSYYLADARLTDHWFTDKDHIFKVKTDNAENLTIYPLGDKTPANYLEEDTVYFRRSDQEVTPGGRKLFTDSFMNLHAQQKDRAGISGYDLFKERDAVAVKTHEAEPARVQTATPGNPKITLMPDENNTYRLFWDWNGNDETAMVEITQYGEKVGKIAVIPVKQFKQNGNNMNVTAAVMDGKPIPAGILVVTIRDQNRNILIDSAEVPGRREVVRYRLDGSSLELKPGSRNTVDKLVLRTTDTDGTLTYYPLYPSTDEHPWIYRGLTLIDGRVVEDPTMADGRIIPVDMGK